MNSSINSSNLDSLKYINTKSYDYSVVQQQSQDSLIKKTLLMNKILSINNLREIEKYIKTTNGYASTVNLIDDLVNIINLSPIETVLPFDLIYSDIEFNLYNDYLKKNGKKLLDSYTLNNRIVKKKPIPYFKLGSDSINRELDGRENNRYVDMVTVNKHNRFLC